LRLRQGDEAALTTAEPQGEQVPALLVKAEMLEALLEREKETVDDLRKRLDRSEDRVLALSHEPPRKGFFARLFGA
jgi:hypothetical protein